MTLPGIFPLSGPEETRARPRGATALRPVCGPIAGRIADCLQAFRAELGAGFVECARRACAQRWPLAIPVNVEMPRRSGA
jgi:hypothetical protein